MCWSSSPRGWSASPLSRRRQCKLSIPVVNIDREFSSPTAYRTWIGGDNYGIGKAAADLIADELKCQGNVVEIQGVAGISVTELAHARASPTASSAATAASRSSPASLPTSCLTRACR